MKNDEKKVNGYSEEELKLMEKEFTKTKFGKFMVAVLIISCILIAIGLIFSVFQAIVYARNLDIDQYQPIIDLGDTCMDYGGKGMFLSMFVYLIMLPIVNLKDDEKTNKDNKKNNSEISKIIKSPLLKIIIVASVLISLLNLLYDIGFIVGQLIAK